MKFQRADRSISDEGKKDLSKSVSGHSGLKNRYTNNNDPFTDNVQVKSRDITRLSCYHDGSNIFPD